MSPTQRVGTKQAVTTEIDTSGVTVLCFHYEIERWCFRTGSRQGEPRCLAERGRDKPGDGGEQSRKTHDLFRKPHAK